MQLDAHTNSISFLINALHSYLRCQIYSLCIAERNSRKGRCRGLALITTAQRLFPKFTPNGSFFSSKQIKIFWVFLRKVWENICWKVEALWAVHVLRYNYYYYNSNNIREWPWCGGLGMDLSNERSHVWFLGGGLPWCQEGHPTSYAPVPHCASP